MRPPGVSKLSVVALREKKAIDCSRRLLAIGGIFFDPRSTFDLVMAGQMSIFGEIDVFSSLCCELNVNWFDEHTLAPTKRTEVLVCLSLEHH